MPSELLRLSLPESRSPVVSASKPCAQVIKDGLPKDSSSQRDIARTLKLRGGKNIEAEEAPCMNIYVSKALRGSACQETD